MHPLKAQADSLVEGKPPVFRSWNQLYVFVLLLHAVIVFLFYLFKITFS